MCSAKSAKSSPGKISPKHLIPRQKSALKPITGKFFMHELQSEKSEFFGKKATFFTLLSNFTHFIIKKVKNLMPRQNLPPKT